MRAYLDPSVVQRIVRYHEEGCHVETIAKVLELPTDLVAMMIISQRRKPKWRGAAWEATEYALPEPLAQECPDGPTDDEVQWSSYMPTPDEIRAECRKLQQNWNRRDRMVRSGGMERQPADVLKEVWL